MLGIGPLMSYNRALLISSTLQGQDLCKLVQETDLMLGLLPDNTCLKGQKLVFIEITSLMTECKKWWCLAI